jgi:hypothetical protein
MSLHLLREYIQSLLLEDIVHDAPELDVIEFLVGDETEIIESRKIQEQQTTGSSRAKSGSEAQDAVALTLLSATRIALGNPNVEVAYTAPSASTNPDVILDIRSSDPEPAGDRDIESKKAKAPAGRFVRIEVKSDKSSTMKFSAELKRGSMLAKEFQLVAQDFIDATVDPQVRINSKGKRKASGFKISSTFQQKIDSLGLDPNAFVDAYARSLASATSNDDAYFAIRHGSSVYVWLTGAHDPLQLKNIGKIGKLSAKPKWQADVSTGDAVVKIDGIGGYTLTQGAGGEDVFYARPKINMKLDKNTALELPIVTGNLTKTMQDRYKSKDLKSSMSTR